MDFPKVSIIIPLYNRKDYIATTLNSIIKQTYQNWEIIVVDDGSTDGSDTIVKEAQATEERIKYVKREREPKGAPTCRNIGTNLAEGELIIFLDSDDILSSQCIEGRVNVVQHNPNYGFWVFGCSLFSRVPGDMEAQWNTLLSPVDDLDRFLAMDVPWQTSGPIWRKQVLIELGGWLEGLKSWQDWELAIRVLCNKVPYLKTDQKDYYYRAPRQGTISKETVSKQQWQKQTDLYQHINQLLRKNNLLTAKRKNSLAGLYFALMQIWFLNKKDRATALRIWSLCFKEGIISLQKFLIGGLYVVFSFQRFEIKRVGEIIWSRWDKDILVKGSDTYCWSNGVISKN